MKNKQKMHGILKKLFWKNAIEMLRSCPRLSIDVLEMTTATKERNNESLHTFICTVDVAAISSIS